MQDVSRTHKALLELSLALNTHLELSEILSKVADYARDLTGSEDASIVLWNRRLNRFESSASTTPVGDDVGQRVRRSGGASRWILDNKDPLIVSDTYDDPFTANAMIVESGIRAYAGVPVLRVEEVLGVLYVLSHRVRTYEASEIEQLQELAGMAAIAIHNAEQVRSLRELKAFRDAMMLLAVHDLRHPLTIAKGYMEILVEDLSPLQPELSSHVKVIENAHTRMDELITGVLQFEKLTAEGDIEVRAVDLNDIARQAVAGFELTAAQKSLTLTLALTEQQLMVNGNELLLQEALANLISNAVKYTPAHGSVTVCSEQSDETYSLSVHDTGPGIDPTEVDKLFLPFSRLSSAGKERGTGLGLSLVKSVIEKHGGQVTYRNGHGSGSVFQIDLPAPT